jgi:hypothetical protein
VKSLLRRLFRLATRLPWLLPLISFAAGWLGYVLVQRGEALARIVALLALLGWFWLLLEPWVRPCSTSRGWATGVQASSET